MKRTPLTRIPAVLLIVLIGTLQSQADYVVMPLTKDEAKKFDITVKSRSNGDSGIKVWLEIDKEGLLGDFAWIDLRMEGERGKHLLSTRLQPHPVTHGQSKDTMTVSFSVDPTQLKTCSFWLCKGGGIGGGEILTIKVSDYVDL